MAKGATVVAGGKARPDLGPFFYEPTVLADVTADMDVYREETFGPLVSIYPYASVDEAVEAVNDTEYGLNASVYCGDTKKGREIGRAAHGRHRQRQRRLLVGLGQRRRPDGRHEGVRASAAATAGTACSSTPSPRPSPSARPSPRSSRTPGTDGDGYAKRFTALLKAAKHLPR